MTCAACDAHIYKQCSKQACWSAEHIAALQHRLQQAEEDQEHLKQSAAEAVAVEADMASLQEECLAKGAQVATFSAHLSLSSQQLIAAYLCPLAVTQISTSLLPRTLWIR